MRIAMISDCYAPHMGGIETQVGGLASRIAEAGHRVEVVTATPGPRETPAAEMRGGDHVHVTRAALDLPGFLPVNPFAGPALERALRRCDVAHIHMGVISPLAVHALRLALRMRVPTVVTFHCMLDGWMSLLRASGIYRGRGAGLYVTAVSRVLADQVRRVSGVEDVGLVPNGVELSRWCHIAACRAQRPGPGDPLRFVSALRFMPRKRPLALVAVWARLRARLGQECPYLDLFGEGVEAPGVRAAVRAAGLDGLIRCPGRLDPADLARAYVRADGFVLASRRESFGIAALEARAAGLPVFAREGTGVSDIITAGLDGEFAGSDGELADLLTRLAGDEVAMIAYQRAAQEPPALTWQTSVDAALEAYRRVLGAHAP